MKKEVLHRVVMMVMMTMVTISFTACGGGDSSDPLDNPNPQDNQGTTDIPQPNTQDNKIDPCLNWGCSVDDVKAYMGNSMELVDEITGKMASSLEYRTKGSDYVILYTFMPGLRGVYLYYSGVNEQGYQNLIEKYSKKFNVKLDKYYDKDTDTYAYAGNCYINQVYCGVMINMINNRVGVAIATVS